MIDNQTLAMAIFYGVFFGDYRGRPRLSRLKEVTPLSAKAWVKKTGSKLRE